PRRRLELGGHDLVDARDVPAAPRYSRRERLRAPADGDGGPAWVRERNVRVGRPSMGELADDRSLAAADLGSHGREAVRTRGRALRRLGLGSGGPDGTPGRQLDLDRARLDAARRRPRPLTPDGPRPGAAYRVGRGRAVRRGPRERP